MSTPWRALAAAATVFLLGACREAPRDLVFNLVAEAPVARQVQAHGVRVFVSPPATLYSAGWRGRRAGVPPRLVSNAILRWREPLPREAVLDIERPDWGSGDVQITLNRRPLGRLSLGRGRGSYKISLPSEAQYPGLNRLKLSFVGGPADGPPPPAGPPVRLHGVAVRPRGQGAPARPVSARAEGVRGPAVVLPAGTGLEYALRLPESAELRFTPRADGDGDGPSVFRVALTLQGEPVRELLTVRVASGGTHPEVHVPLPGEAGRLALLGLHSAGPEESVGRWGAPGVYGFPEPPPPEAPGLLDRLEDLRRRLRGTGVLLIVLDAAAARHVGCYGYERDTTPEIDRLAAEGQVFEHAYSPTSYTGTAMASLWTSQHPEQHHHGVLPHDRLPTHRVVLAELLQEKNVPSTAFIGNVVATAAGTVRGFAEVNPLHLTVKQAGKTAPEESPLGRIEAWISKAQRGSFLAYVHYLEPHFPYNPPPPFDAMFGGNPSPLPRATRSWIRDVNAGRTQMTTDELFHLKRLYDGNLAAVDHEIGLLRRRLEAKGHWEELVVIVTADHGEAFWEHGHLTHAGQVYEEEVRIPLIIKLPGREIEPRRIAEPVDLLDVGATLADILGVAEAARPHFEGRSLLPALVGDHLAPRPLVTRTLAERPTYSFLQGHLKLVHDPNWGGSELYDLGRDQAEKRDLSEAHPVTTEVFRQSLYRWLRDLDRGEAAGEGRPLVTPENEEALRELGYLE